MKIKIKHIAFGDTAKACLREKSIVLSEHIRKGKSL